MPEAPPITGRHRLLSKDGAARESGEGALQLDETGLSLTPKGAGPLRIELADVDAMQRKEHSLELLLESGERLELTMLGRRFGELAEGLGGALREFQAKHLLLTEPTGGEAFEGEVATDGKPGPAQLRVYATSLAILPVQGVPFSVPFGELTAVSFEEQRWAVELGLGARKVTLTRLGKQTQPFLRLLETRLFELRSRNSGAVAYLLPTVPSLKLRSVGQILLDGVPVRRGQLDAIDPGIWTALLGSAVVKSLRDEVELLSQRSPAEEIALGLKETNFLQDDERLPDEPDESAPAEPTPLSGRVIWLAFPLVDADRSRPGNAIAVEVASREGRATYLFRIAPPDVYRAASLEALTGHIREQIRVVSQALVAMHFRREPIYLDDEAIRAPRFGRYRLALRLSEPLKSARAAFLGRAIHGAHWQAQLEQALTKAVS